MSQCPENVPELRWRIDDTPAEGNIYRSGFMSPSISRYRESITK